jgi:hypothetical protein
MMTPPTITGTNSTTYGFGLFMGKLGALKLVQHGGADASHRSQFLYFPEIDAGLTVQSNFSGFDGSVANRIARAFFASEIGTTSRPVAEAYDAASFKPESFDVFAGRYAMDRNPSMVLTFSPFRRYAVHPAHRPGQKSHLSHFGLQLRAAHRSRIGHFSSRRNRQGHARDAQPEWHRPRRPVVRRRGAAVEADRQ